MRTTVVVIGAGQAGLAMSRCLADRGVDHVVLERGEVAGAWRTQRWDSMRLLTPNWLSRLPGYRYRGDDPDGYMSAAQVAGYLEGYCRTSGAPVRPGTTVVGVHPTPSGLRVDTDAGSWRCRAVVVATGGAADPLVPAVSTALPARITQLTAVDYRRPDQVGDGGVLVVGASASGVQIADELRRAGREVTLAAGAHTRVPRTYRGRDIHWWMDAIGHLDERYDEVADIAKARRAPSLQLVGAVPRRTLDLAGLSAAGVRVVGRLVGASERRAQFSGSLAALTADADLRQLRLLDRIDRHVEERGWTDVCGPPDRPHRTRLPSPPTQADLAGVGTVVWATGYRPRYPWLDPALLDRAGRIRHVGGVLDAPGLYVLGLPFTRRRKSSFLDGVGPDAEELCALLVARLGRGVAA
jgi:putative flavoprotein involved in K+ transport